jgi:hypothetical protein
MRWLGGPQRVLLMSGLLLAALASGQSATAQDIWFTPSPGPRGLKDYMSLFQPDAPWQQAASHVKVFGVNGWLLLHGSDADLMQIFTYLRHHHIDLLVGIGAVSGGPDRCGYHVEGYSAAGDPHRAAVRINSLGGDPQYFGMDEPLYYGHVFGRAGQTFGCHWSIPDLARDVGSKVRQIRSVFPNAQFGEVEPFGFPDATWLSDIAAWVDAFQAATGSKLAYFRLDVVWTRPWQASLPALAQLLRDKGIPLQVIYDPSGQDRSDAEAAADIVKQFQEVETALGHQPDAVSFQSWVRYPERALPESDPNTLTGVIDQFIAWKRSHR